MSISTVMNDIMELCARNEPGVDVCRLKAGTKLIVKTRNSTYLLITTNEPGELIAKGGEKLTTPTTVQFSGCTWGGSAIRVGWLGLDMHMEMRFTGRCLTTTAVQSIRLIGANKDWYYDLP